MPLVSVVIPTFGRPRLLLRAVVSVLVQTLTDIELIVVIDGRDPETIGALEEVGDKRLRWIEHERRMGAGLTRDDGARAGTGRWIAFLDDDDEWTPEKLERQLALAGDAPAVLMTLSRVVTRGGDFIRPTRPYRIDRPVDEWLFDRRSWFGGGESFLQTSSLVFPREMFERLGFHDTKQHEEWELVIRAVKELGYPLLTAEEPLVTYYESAGTSLSATYTWSRSLEWIDGLHGIVTPRAHAAFCLAVVGQHTADSRQWEAWWPLLSSAFRRGRPTPKQLLAFTLCWVLPKKTRRRIRQLLQAERGPVHLTAH